MRKIIVLEFITLDGVMQAGGSPDEDKSDGFKYGGWAAPYLDDGPVADEFMAKQLGYNADLLLGRKTFEAFATFWPTHGDMWPGVNDVKKYVVSDTGVKLDGWNNSVRLKNLADIKKLKQSEGPDIQVHGSGVLVQSLLEHDLVDELWLKTLPIILGQGKRLFSEGNIAAAFTLTDTLVTPNGVIFANYKRVEEVKIGNAGA